MLLAMLPLLPASSSGELIVFIVMIMPACMLCIHTHSPTIKGGSIAKRSENHIIALNDRSTTREVRFQVSVPLKAPL